MTAPAKLSSREYLLEHCNAPGCANGLVKRLDGTVGLCAVCNGTTRRLRHTHDAASAIDFDSATDGAGASGLMPAGIDREKPSDACGTGPARTPETPPVAARVVSESPETLHAAAYTDDYATYLAFIAERQRREARVRELVALLRGPENSAPMTELFDLLEAGHG